MKITIGGPVLLVFVFAQIILLGLKIAGIDIAWAWVWLPATILGLINILVVVAASLKVMNK